MGTFSRARKVLHTLDNPVWSALTTRQAHFAEGDDLARRYPVKVSLLGTLKRTSPDAFESLARATKDDVVGLFCFAPSLIPAGWKIIHASNLVQMICPSSRAVAEQNFPHVEELTAANADEMVALARLTNPGPFGKHTQELGLYLGICQKGHWPRWRGNACVYLAIRKVARCAHIPIFKGAAMQGD